jgi:hypothetical protein
MHHELTSQCYLGASLACGRHGEVHLVDLSWAQGCRAKQHQHLAAAIHVAHGLGREGVFQLPACFDELQNILEPSDVASLPTCIRYNVPAALLLQVDVGCSLACSAEHSADRQCLGVAKLWRTFASLRWDAGTRLRVDFACISRNSCTQHPEDEVLQGPQASARGDVAEMVDTSWWRSSWSTVVKV